MFTGLFFMLMLRYAKWEDWSLTVTNIVSSVFNVGKLTRANGHISSRVRTAPFPVPYPVWGCTRLLRAYVMTFSFYKLLEVIACWFHQHKPHCQLSIASTVSGERPSDINFLSIATPLSPRVQYCLTNFCLIAENSRISVTNCIREIVVWLVSLPVLVSICCA